MGGEFGQWMEWDFRSELDWALLDLPTHQGVRRAVADLNRLYRHIPSLHRRDCDPSGFRWIVVDDEAQSVAAWLRFGDEGDPPVAVVCNFTPVPRTSYRLGLPSAGVWREVFNSDAEVYGGSGMGNLGRVEAWPHASHGYPASAEIVIPPLAAVFLQYAGEDRS
jgi:1,4-alpha-glucan branching enzyme